TGGSRFDARMGLRGNFTRVKPPPGVGEKMGRIARNADGSGVRGVPRKYQDWDARTFKIVAAVRAISPAWKLFPDSWWPGSRWRAVRARRRWALPPLVPPSAPGGLSAISSASSPAWWR